MISRSRARLLARRLAGRATPAPPPRLSANAYEAPGNQWYPPVLGGASTFGAQIAGGAIVRDALAVLDRLSPDDYQRYVGGFYRAGLERFGDGWRYADINTALLCVARLLRPASYLEIGVRRGRSLAMVASVAPACDIVACDMFVEGYAGMENPGPETVRAALAGVRFTGGLSFLVGDSHRVLPGYFTASPAAYFDVITVDGDHSRAGARADLETVMPRLKIGGVLVFDDVANPAHPELRRVWSETVERRRDYSSFVFDEIGFGVAIAVRHA